MKIINRQARYNYELQEEFEAGIVLTGPEVKSAKKGQLKLDEAFVKIDSSHEVWLVNCHIHPYQPAGKTDDDPRRSRKLLLHKSQILALVKKMEGKNLTIIPVSCYTSRGKIKFKLALAKGRKKWEKREKIKKRELERKLEKKRYQEI